MLAAVRTEASVLGAVLRRVSSACLCSGKRLNAPACGAQVTQEELQTAMGFLKEQLGEDELRALLDRLNDWQQDGATPIDVGKLMKMAESAEPLAPGSSS